LTCNPTIVRTIQNAIDHELEIERRKSDFSFDNSALKKEISRLKLPELSEDQSMSIFGVAAAIKATTPPDRFIPKQGLTMLEVILETLYEQMSVLCHKNELDVKYVDLINEQYDKFSKNFGFYNTKYPAVLNDYLGDLIQVVIKVMDGKGLTDVANKFIDIKERLHEILPSIK
jgi:hypothetical protein